MKKIVIILTFLTLTIKLDATIHTVSLSSDDKDSPVEGMFRYYVNNASTNDTIVFTVDSIGLAAEIKITYKSLTIDGGEGVIVDGGQNGRVFNISFDRTNNIIIENITIQNGLIDDDYAWGGGMYAFGSGEGLTVKNCTFRNNTANTDTGDGQGGALRTQGGIYVNCFFLNNALTGTGTSNSGGGILSVGSQFINCLIAGNDAKYGGGIYATTSSEVINCTVTQNSSDAVGNGAGVGSEGGSVFTNCIFYNNKSSGTEDNVNNYSGSFDYCAFEQGNPLAINTNIELSETPFLNSGTDSLSLKENSECIDKGNSSVEGLPEEDIIGNDRINGVKVDIGAYEYHIPIVITGSVIKEEGTFLASYDLHDDITVEADGSFTIIEEGLGNINKGDTLLLKTAPAGYEFYPKMIIVDEAKTVEIIAYKGIVVDEIYPTGSNINWNVDTVNVFVDVIVDSSLLTINKGTKVKFHNWNAIKVSGTGQILAQGTKDEPILFTPADTTGYNFPSYYDVTGAWHGIRFTDMTSADSSIFEYCTMQYGKGSPVNGYGEPEYGGAISIYSQDENFSKLKLVNCNISNNSSYGSNSRGGGISLHNGGAILINCNISNNVIGGANNYGGGIYLWSSTATLINCNIVQCGIVTEYPISAGGGGIYLSSGEVTLYNTIMYNNFFNESYQSIQKIIGTIEVYNCDIQDGNTFFADAFHNCIDADPLFLDEEAQDYSLSDTSPCINQGDTNNIADLLPLYDIAGNNRIHQNYIDIGVNEYQSDISSQISGILRYEDGDPIPDYTIFPGITTNSEGHYIIEPGINDINEGDTLILNNAPAGYDFYPGRLVVGINQPKNVDITAYKGLVVDKYSSFNDSTFWNEDTVNVFSDIVLNSAPLVIKQGTKIKFYNYNAIRISENGSIISQGTLDSTIVFTSAYPNTDPESISTKGNWEGICFRNMNTTAPKSLIEFSKVEYGKTFEKGGGFCIENFDNVIIKNTEITNNSSNNGGGLYILQSDISIINCYIHHNSFLWAGVWTSSNGGGGIYSRSSDASIIGSVISDNNSYSGGGIFVRYSNLIIANCNIADNYIKTTFTNGAGILTDNSNLKIYNSILWNNQGEQVIKSPYQTSTIEMYNSCIQGGNTFTASIYDNCIDTYPVFMDTINSNYKIKEGSPCINQGITNSISYLIPDLDIAGNPRILGKKIDIGAYEFEETTLYILAEKVAGADTTIQFEAKVFMGSACSWSWDFNDDGAEDSNVQNPTYTYSSTGNYTVRLIAMVDEFGTTDTATLVINIIAAPVASFTADTTSGEAPLTINFTDKSSNEPTTWLWDFGDGETSSEQNPDHTYSYPGTYTVMLIASNEAGYDTIEKVDYITVREPIYTPLIQTERSKIIVSPNPSKNFITISADKSYRIKLIDISGNLLLDRLMSNAIETLDISNYPDGLLILYLINNNETIIRKLIKE